MRTGVLPLATWICGTGFLISGIGAIAQAGAAPQTDTGSRAAQVEHGAAVYGEKCAACHGGDLQASFNAPALSGNGFQSQWGGKTVSELFGTIGNIQAGFEPFRPGPPRTVIDNDGILPDAIEVGADQLPSQPFL